MRYLMARGLIAVNAQPVVIEADMPIQRVSTWTWYDRDKKQGLTIVRQVPEFNAPRLINEWHMWAIECEITPSVFNRMLIKRPIPGPENV